MPLPPDRILQRRLAVGERLRAARLWRNLSQHGLAERAGVDIKTVNRLENGLTNAGLDTLLDLADALAVSPACLMPGGPRPGEE